MRAVTRSKAAVAGGISCPKHSADVQYPKKKVCILSKWGDPKAQSASVSPLTLAFDE